MNTEQLKYFAECLKLTGIAQLTVIGFGVALRDPIDVPLFINSIFVWITLILLGTYLLD